MGVGDVPEIGDAAGKSDLEHLAGIGLRRQGACCGRWCLGARQAIGGSLRQAILDVDVGNDDDTVLGKGFIPAGVVAMIVRVDQIFDRQVGDG